MERRRESEPHPRYQALAKERRAQLMALLRVGYALGVAAGMLGCSVEEAESLKKWRPVRVSPELVEQYRRQVESEGPVRGIHASLEAEADRLLGVTERRPRRRHRVYSERELAKRCQRLRDYDVDVESLAVDGEGFGFLS